MTKAPSQGAAPSRSAALPSKATLCPGLVSADGCCGQDGGISVPLVVFRLLALYGFVSCLLRMGDTVVEVAVNLRIVDESWA